MPKSFYKITIWSKIWGVLQKKNFRHRVGSDPEGGENRPASFYFARNA
eukprot:COSAG04_NODE_32209_length_253_cov_0.921569_1_plen_47_part_01